MINKIMSFIRTKWHSDLLGKNYSVILNDIWEITQNINLCVTGKNYSQLSDYAYYKEIHNAMPLFSYDGEFGRFGKDNDGGYIMPLCLSENKIAYSFGIGSDVTWDKEMAKFGYEVFMYDHTIKSLPENDPRFHWKQIGIGPKDEGIIKRLDTIIKENNHSKESNMVLKMDVESAEWESINAISDDILQKFEIIVLELHGLTDHNNHRLIIDVLNKLQKSFYMIHIHGNVVSRVCFCGDCITPDLCEITMINKKDRILNQTNLNTLIYLDQTNIPSFVDAYLRNWNV